jgi:CheY-like chemotaxis protein
VDEPLTILMAEDESNDVFLMRRAVRKMNAPVSLQVVKDGAEAIDYLAGNGKYANRTLYPLPSLILLDIKMPRKNGFEVLEWLKENDALAQIPVVMHTSSRVKADVEKAHELGAQAYLVKPVHLQELQRLFTATDEFLSVHAH